ncbi:hypothetical protein ACQKWADRAFT_146458 [Trichoderma austrokoningii]
MNTRHMSASFTPLFLFLFFTASLITGLITLPNLCRLYSEKKNSSHTKIPSCHLHISLKADESIAVLSSCH